MGRRFVPTMFYFSLASSSSGRLLVSGRHFHFGPTVPDHSETAYHFVEEDHSEHRIRRWYYVSRSLPFYYTRC